MKRGIVFLLALVLVISGILVGCGSAKGTAEWHADQAWELINQGRYDEAIEQCNKAIRLDPQYAEAYFNRGTAYKLQGKKAEAIADLEKFITLSDDPELIAWAEQELEELSE